MIENVIFDMDGTILYTLEDLKNSTCTALKMFDYPEKSIDEIKKFVGNGVRKLIECALPAETPPDITEKVLKVFKEDYTKNMYKNTKPYDNIKNLLLNLKENRIKTAVVSNKFDLAVKELCKKYFDGLIDVSVGQSDNIFPKPSPDGIIKAMRILNAKPDNCIYAGDSDIDVCAAHNAGLKCIGVTWGYRSLAILKSAGADYIVNEPLEILGLIKNV